MITLTDSQGKAGAHTSGPWTVDETTGQDLIWSSDHQIVAQAIAKNWPEDARLIAASPDLLASLEEILDYRGGADSALDDEYVMDRAQAAIAKATGGAA